MKLSNSVTLFTLLQIINWIILSEAIPANTTLDDYSGLIKYEPPDAWGHRTDEAWAEDYFDSTCSFTTTNEASFEFSFTGIGITLFVPTLRTHADRVVIFDDQRSDVLSVSTGEGGYSQEWWSSGVVPYGEHTVQVIHVDQREGVLLALDFINVLDDVEMQVASASSAPIIPIPRTTLISAAIAKSSSPSSALESPVTEEVHNEKFGADKMAILIVLPLLITLVLFPLFIFLFLRHRRLRSQSAAGTSPSGSMREKDGGSLRGGGDHHRRNGSFSTSFSYNPTEAHTILSSGNGGTSLSLMPQQATAITREIPRSNSGLRSASSGIVQENTVSNAKRTPSTKIFQRVLSSFLPKSSSSSSSSPRSRSLPSGTKPLPTPTGTWSIRSSYNSSLFTTTATATSECSPWSGGDGLSPHTPTSVHGIGMDYHPTTVDTKGSNREFTRSPSLAGTCNRLSVSTKHTVEMSEFGGSSCESNPFSSLHAVSLY